MEIIWAPWRMEYLQKNVNSEKGCFFCRAFSEDRDEHNYILFRKNLGFIMLNIYPYNNGHIMVAPIRHTGDITLLDSNEISELMFLVQRAVIGLNKAYSPNGYNIGINQGAAAGAGVADHLHIHVVPRWQGDTNFMPVFSETKVMPQYLHDTYKRLEHFFKKCEA